MYRAPTGLQDMIAGLNVPSTAPLPMGQMPSPTDMGATPMPAMSLPTPTPAPAPMPAPAARRGGGLGQTLQAIMPFVFAAIAGKQGGPMAAGAMLQGLSQAAARKRQEAMAQAEAEANRAATEEERQMRLAQLRMQQQRDISTFIRNAQESIAQAVDPADAAARLKLFEREGGKIYGLSPGFLSGADAGAEGKATQKLAKEAADKVKELRDIHRENYEAIAASGTVMFNGRPHSFQELEALAGTLVTDRDGKRVGVQSQGKDPFEAAAPGTSEYSIRVRQALRVAQQKKGSPLTPEEINAEMSRISAEPAPRDPILDALSRNALANSQRLAEQMPPAKERQIDQWAVRFQSEPVVRRTQTIAEAYDFVSSLPDNTTSPADDQALVYAFAKAMDPESVVREGEYATVQKYAQSWLSAFGFSALRVVNESQFLTPASRKMLKETIRKRYQAARGPYENVRAQYAKRINQITGQSDGETRLTDYAAAFPSTGGRAEQAATGGAAAAQVGERRTINGQLAEWDGKGWKPVK